MKRKRDPKRKLLDDIATKPACEWRWPKIGLFVPTGHHVPAPAFHAFMEIARTHRLPPLPMARSIQLDMVRTRACEALMRCDDLTHLLMLDEDHIHDPSVIPQLAQWCVFKKSEPDEVEVVGGLNFSRSEPHKPCCFVDKDGEWSGGDADNIGQPLNFPKEGLMPAAIVGTGSILIAKTALEKLDRPFFFMPQVWNDPYAVEAWPGEDVGFAMNCRKNGVRQYIDRNCSSPHITWTTVTEADFDPQALADAAKSPN